MTEQKFLHDDTIRLLIGLALSPGGEFKGRVYNIAMCSGGFVISSKKFIEVHNSKKGL